ncbi:glycoside hydrolase family 20 protein [Dysgonomonas sp. 511]|uniref:glycoside hydrolase family 20 protein n=1 Tax=Dysgonomonas sp. 511 TaxID=2302930 RepID=UPI0013D6FA99|nr:glycoside hydrolase family 20 protein [Dysgonomonas sp. 511]NDV78720.1 beta-N-acetylhexosaminidase [Dysgonomonas sp. 511]
MNILSKILLISACCLIIGCGSKHNIEADYEIVPLPFEVKNTGGEPFILDDKTMIVYPEGNETLKQAAGFLSEYINLSIGLKPDITGDVKDQNVIVLKTGYKGDNPEAYQLLVSKDKITIQGVAEAAVFYGMQTLRKSMPVGHDITTVSFPATEITDYPRFGYRGMHLDVSRHMFPIESVKKYIDILALHNINRFHWHLTDDQGWRIEIKKYPELTKTGSMRAQTVIGKNSGEYDGKPYGGFYTQDEIKEVVKYAEERFITIIPEVDLPGHMLAALTTYPNLGCTGGPYKVAETWGVFDDVLCAGNEDIYPFLEGVFDEVIELFPSEYIHVGGDECPKTRWEKCPKCQAKIKALGLKADAGHTAEQGLQSYVIQRIEKYINSKGRKVIGWDEILEGGIAPNATIMSWQGIEGGTEAALQHHDAIMTPTTYLYFDYYQALDIKDELFGIGGYVPVEKVYSYEPMPEGLTKEQQKHIIGTQANVWTEYMKDFNHVEYMVLPRMAALSEIQWTQPEKKDYQKFLPRLAKLTKLYAKLGYNFATHIFNIEGKIETDNANKQLKMTLSTFDNAPIFYTLDGSEPTEKSTLYEGVIQIDKNVDIKAVAIRDGIRSKIYERKLDINKATFKPITLENKPWGRYSYAGAPTLVDGQAGGDVYASGGWIGFQQDMIATIDLEETTPISKVRMGTFVDVASWIFNVSEYSIYVSDDNKDFKQIYSKEFAPVEESQPVGPVYLDAEFSKVDTRYVKVVAKYLRSQPEWAGGAGKPASIFIDEIQVN